jgi:hypothetical protein
MPACYSNGHTRHIPQCTKASTGQLLWWTLSSHSPVSHDGNRSVIAMDTVVTFPSFPMTDAVLLFQWTLSSHSPISHNGCRPVIPMDTVVTFPNLPWWIPACYSNGHCRHLPQCTKASTGQLLWWTLSSPSLVQGEYRAIIMMDTVVTFASVPRRVPANYYDGHCRHLPQCTKASTGQLLWWTLSSPSPV